MRVWDIQIKWMILNEILQIWNGFCRKMIKNLIFNLNFAAVKTHCARIAPAPLGGAAAWSYLKNARFWTKKNWNFEHLFAKNHEIRYDFDNFAFVNFFSKIELFSLSIFLEPFAHEQIHIPTMQATKTPINTNGIQTSPIL